MEEKLVLYTNIIENITAQKVAKEEQTPRQRHQIRMGKRARDRMMAANLRLVVSVAKKYQNRIALGQGVHDDLSGVRFSCSGYSSYSVVV